MPAALPRQEVRVVERLEALSHPAELRADAPPLGLAGVGREHQFHGQPVERPLHLLGRQATFAEVGDPAGK